MRAEKEVTGMRPGAGERRRLFMGRDREVLQHFNLWLLGGMTCAILVAACLKHGLFFSADVNELLIVILAGTIICMAATSVNEGMIKMRRCGQRTGRKLKWTAFAQQCMAWMHSAELRTSLWPLALAMLFGLHAWLGPGNRQGSVEEMFRWSLLAAFALLAAMLARQPHGARWFACGWQLAGGVLVLSGLLAVCGMLPLPGGVMRTADPELSFAGARLGGLLQYPNAYGAVVGMYALERLAAAAAVLARPVRAGRLLAAALPLMPALLALLLSESRGAWLATGCAAVAAWGLQRRGARLPLLLAAAAPFACAAWLYRQLAAAQLAPAPLPGLLALAGAWAAALLGTLLLHRLRHSGARARAAALAATALACASAAALAAGSVAGRFAAGAGTGLSRLEMWRDALKHWAAAPWAGHGGETWRDGYRAIQTSPYVGGEVHSGPLDLALDTGLIGLLLVFGWICLTLRSVRGSAARWVPPFMVFILHGAMDFDWSYALPWMLFIWLGAWASAAERKSAAPDMRNGQSRSVSRRPGTGQPLLPAVASLLALLLWLGGTGMLVGRHISAGQQYRQAWSSLDQDDAGMRREALLSALRLNPFMPDLALELARSVPVRQAEDILQYSLSHASGDWRLLYELGRCAAVSGEGERAASFFARAIANNRYDSALWTSALRWMDQAAKQERALGLEARSRHSAAMGVRMYEHYLWQVEKVKEKGGRNDRSFAVTPVARMYGEQLRQLAANQYSTWKMADKR